MKKWRIQMKEQAIQKINKIGEISGKITGFCKAMVGIGIGTLLVGAILCFFIPDKGLILGTETQKSIEIDMEKLHPDVTEEEIDYVVEELNDGSDVEIESGVIDVEISGEEHVPDTIERTEHGFKIVSVEQRYDMSIRDLSWGLLALAFILGLTQVTLYFVGFLCKAFRDCESPFEENVIKKMQNLAYALIPWAFVTSFKDGVVEWFFKGNRNISWSLDLGVVLIVLVVFLLVYIFKYGAILQQESDETL
jgi:hypothetical protein